MVNPPLLFIDAALFLARFYRLLIRFALLISRDGRAAGAGSATADVVQPGTMKKIFNFAKKKKHASGTPDSGSVLSVGYELKDKDLGKVHKAAAAGDVGKLKQLSKKNDINQLDKENRSVGSQPHP